MIEADLEGVVAGHQHTIKPLGERAVLLEQIAQASGVVIFAGDRDGELTRVQGEPMSQEKK